MTLFQQMLTFAVVMMLAAGQLLFRKSVLGIPRLSNWSEFIARLLIHGDNLHRRSGRRRGYSGRTHDNASGMRPGPGACRAAADWSATIRCRESPIFAGGGVGSHDFRTWTLDL